MNTSRSRIEFWFALIWGILLRLTLLVGTVYFIYRVRSIIGTVLVSVLLAVGIAPLVEILDTPRLIPLVRPTTRRFIVTLLVFVLLFLVLVASYYLLVTPVGEELEQLIGNWPYYQKMVARRLETIQQHYERLPPDVRQFLQQQDFSSITSTLAANVRSILQNTWRSTWVLMELILIPVLAYYFVVDSRSLRKEFIFLVPRRRRREALVLLREVREVLKSYVNGQVILALIAGVVVGTGLHALGINYALAMGGVAAITRVIPIVGPIVGGIPIVLLATAQSWEIGVWVLVFFSLLHLFESKILMPKVIGYQVRLHPAIIIIVLLIGAEFCGLMGMFLAAPIAAIVKILVNYYVIRPRQRHDRRRHGGRGLPSRAEDLEIEHRTFAAPGHHPGAH